MNSLSLSLEKNLSELKKLLPSEDIFHYVFQTEDGVSCALLYADGIVNKQLLGDLVARPLSRLNLKRELDELPEKPQKDGGRVEVKLQIIRRATLFPELKEKREFQDAVKEVLDGNIALLIDGISVILIVGAKFLPVRTVMEPPTDVAVKGPREGFIEDIKVNMALVRKRLKTPDLRFETVKIGKRTDSSVAICYLDGISNASVKDEVKEKLKEIEVDCILDSSYIAALIAPHKHSIFKQVGTTEKPDVFAGKIAEGRVGILVDGSPIALTVPFVLTEDFQSSEDYFVSPFMATIFRAIRFIALVIAILLPAFYVSAQLFKMQLAPIGLMLTILSGVKELPLSPSLELMVVLLLLEILKEASIRMPKYVGMSLSVVGALVLGETAVNAGFLSTPTIIVVAFSGICLYTVPNFVETGSILRWIFLIVAGSIGPFGVVLALAFVLYYLLATDAFHAPLLAPFCPFTPRDMRDAIAKYNMQSLSKRPSVFGSQNKTRMRFDGKKIKKEN
ncbi:MAG: spore germination protein [Clostridia bacterium]|nr:spore germination protein [Clostridia bacterium]